MKNKTIWFTQGFSNLFNAISDLRAAAGEDAYRVICSHNHAEFVGAEAADVRLVEPRTSDPAYLDFVVRTALEYQVDVIFPSHSQTFFAKNAKAIEDATGAKVVVVASPETLALIDNKSKLYNALRDKNIVRIPDFHTVTTVEEFDQAYAALTSDHEVVCFKPTVGVYGSGFRILQEKANELADVIAESPNMGIADAQRLMGANKFRALMVMQFLEGDERSVDCVAVDGVLVGGVIRVKSASPVAGQIIESNPALMAQVAALTQELKLNGMFNVQFRDSEGEHFLLEINSRLSGRSYYATVAGFNIPYAAAQLFTGQASIADCQFELKAGLRLGNASQAVVLKLAPANVAGSR